MSWSDMNATTRSKAPSSNGSEATSDRTNSSYGAARRVDKRRRDVDADDVMTQLGKIACDASLATAQVERAPSRRWKQRQELVAVEPRVRVMTRSTRPFDPTRGVVLPGVAEPHSL